ncbi:MFS transporter [Planotetraspora phitsanulokensis]|uniref:MFS transporter n=1 Tax=Planotetraspora phitsanulokensis TaxID=575192 RepID=A0A8J3XD99_9ACTN|nr:MFS transporter [Planotetraspora phitsanulokensis]GII36304.1 MFS transporter [Planotetraspora phitsanulokensis]
MSTTAPVSRTGAIVSVLAAAGITVSVMQTLVVPLIPELPQLLHTSAANATWAITATLLGGAVATPVVGRLGDLYGKRRLLLISTLLLVVGSLVCAPANTLAPMVVGRTLQGFGMGVIPLGISIMRDVLPQERLGSAMAIMSSSLGVGGALGLPASAAVAQNADWHVLFWGSGALGLIAGVLILVFIPESSVRAGGRFDFAGALGLSAGLICLLLPISKGSDWGWGSATTLGLFAASIVILLVWGVWELRHTAPLIDLRTSSRRPILMTNLASVVIGFAMYAMSLIAPQLLQLPEVTGYGLGQSMLEAGLWMAPSGLVMMAVSPFAAKLSAARGPKISLLVGALVIAGGYGVALALMGSAAGVLAFAAVISAGVGFAYAAMPALIMSAAPASESAAANGLNSLMRAIGTSTASAVMGVVLAHMTVRLGPVTVPSEAGFRADFMIGAGVALLAALVVLAIPGRAGGALARRTARQGSQEAVVEGSALR